MVVGLFLAVPWVCLRFVIVVFPDHTHLPFLRPQVNKATELYFLGVQQNNAIYLSLGPIDYTLCIRATKGLARLRIRTVSSEPSLIAYVISTNVL